MTPISRSGVIEHLVPGDVCAVESFAERGLSLFPAEEAAITGAVERRRREFVTVRACASDALARLGLPRHPLVPGAGGAPTWPAGVVGSMTHCAGYRAAAVAPAAEVLGLGIDAEPDRPLPAGVLETIAGPAEARGLRRLPAGGPCWDTLTFSAKEAVYKTWFPLTGTRLAFRDAVVSLRPDGTFEVHVVGPVPVALRHLAGRWSATDGLLATAVVVLR